MMGGDRCDQAESGWEGTHSGGKVLESLGLGGQRQHESCPRLTILDRQ